MSDTTRNAYIKNKTPMWRDKIRELEKRIKWGYFWLAYCGVFAIWDFFAFIIRPDYWWNVVFGSIMVVLYLIEYDSIRTNKRSVKTYEDLINGRF